jgi:hypothetical protein
MEVMSLDMDAFSFPANTPTYLGSPVLRKSADNILDADEDDAPDQLVDLTARDVPQRLYAMTSMQILYPAPNLKIVGRTTNSTHQATHFSENDVVPDTDGTFGVMKMTSTGVVFRENS